MSRHPRDEAERLGVDLEDWATGETLERLVAVKMMAAGLSDTRTRIRNIRGLLGTDRREEWTPVVADILWLVGSAWVDYRAIDRIPALARSHGRSGRTPESR